MNELITACLDVRDITPLVDFPSLLLSKPEHEICDWVFDYVRKFEEPPSVARLQAQFPFFLPIRDDTRLPLRDILEITLKQKRIEYTRLMLNDIDTEMTERGDIPEEKVSELVQMLGQTDGSLSKYSTFDRALYFRKSRLKIGLPIIDRAIGGLANGDYMLIAGRLGVGKSTIAQWLTHNWWAQGYRILYVSKEMLAADVFARIDGIEGSFNPLLLRSSEPEEMMPALSVVSKLAKDGRGEIFIPSREISTPAQTAAIAAHLNVDVIIIDGLYLMSSDQRTSARWERVADVSNQLKQIALNLQVPIIGMTQIKRTGGRDDYTAEDLAYSDALGQDADFVMTVTPSSAVKNRLELQLIKNRFGDIAGNVVYVDFDTMRVIDESVHGRVEEDA